MSAFIMGRATWLQNVSCPEKMVLVAIADVSDDHGLAFMLIDTLMMKSSLSRRGAQTAVAGLIAKGLLARKERHLRSSIFKINVDALPVKRPDPSPLELSDDHNWESFKGASPAPSNVDRGAGDARQGAGDARQGAGGAPILPVGTPVNTQDTPLSYGEVPPDGEKDLFNQPVAEPAPEVISAAQIDSIMQRWKALAADNPLISVPRRVDDTRRAAIVKRSRDFTDNSTDVDQLWDMVFEAIQASRFLRGLSKPGKDREEPWAISFDWMLKPANFKKIIEGNFRDKRAEHEAFDGSGRKLTEHEIAERSLHRRLQRSRERSDASRNPIAPETFRIGYDRPGDRRS